MVDSGLELLYRDEHLVAINKPPGLLVHRSAIDRHERRFAMQLLRDQLDCHVYPVHRLDKPTSGVLLFALSAEVARAVSRLFEQHLISKDYLAVVRGHCPLRGQIDHPLKPDTDKFERRSAETAMIAQEALTHYARLATVELPVEVDRYPQTRYSLVQLHPVTGRRHQLRRHMKHIGYPIIGDAKHGKGVHNRFVAGQYGCKRLLLACTGMTLVHPVSGEELQLRADPGASFQRLLDAFGWRYPP